jgi:hypothetical protein
VEDRENFFAGLTNAELTRYYLAARAKLRLTAQRAKRISMGSGERPSQGNRDYWGSVLFTRLVVTAYSILELLPDPKPRAHWDFSSVASLTRNLVEMYLYFYWLCIDDVADEVRAGRFILMQLHDHGSRRRLFDHDSKPDPDHPAYADLVIRFDANPYLATLPEGQRKNLLRGEKTPFVQDEVIDRMGADRDSFRLFYRFLSQHTHGGPIAFYRMDEHDRGAGVETAHEKKYMILISDLARNTLDDAATGMLKIFPDADAFPVFMSEAAIAAKVERNQGRAKSRSRSKRR